MENLTTMKPKDSSIFFCCRESRIANGGQCVDELGAPELRFEFADAIHHIPLQAFNDRRSSGMSLFKPRERPAKMPKFIQSGH